MSQQYDVLSGKDISSQSSISQADAMQMINQAAPLSNIGLVFVGTVRPDITNNPRMIRYLWLDITDPANPIFKRYIADRTVLVDADVSWTSLGVGIGAILTSMLAARSATGGVDVAKLKLNSDYSATLASAFYVLRVAANGKDLEVVSIDTAVADAGGLALNRLQTTGIGAQKYLGYNAGVLAYKYLDPANDITAALGNRISIGTAIVPGTAKYLIRTNAAGTALEFIQSNNADLFQDGDIAVAKLAQGGAANGDIITWDPSNKWIKLTPNLGISNSATISVSGVVSTSGGTGDFTVQVHTIAHGMAVIPRIVRVVGVQTNAVADIGYNQNDEVDIGCFRTAVNNLHQACVCADATNITIVLATVTSELGAKTTGVYAGIDETKWKVKAYAWK